MLSGLRGMIYVDSIIWKTIQAPPKLADFLHQCMLFDVYYKLCWRMLQDGLSTDCQAERVVKSVDPQKDVLSADSQERGQSGGHMAKHGKDKERVARQPRGGVASAGRSRDSWHSKKTRQLPQQENDANRWSTIPYSGASLHTETVHETAATARKRCEPRVRHTLPRRLNE